MVVSGQEMSMAGHSMADQNIAYCGVSCNNIHHNAP